MTLNKSTGNGPWAAKQESIGQAGVRAESSPPALRAMGQLGGLAPAKPSPGPVTHGGKAFPSGNTAFWCFISLRQPQANNGLLEQGNSESSAANPIFTLFRRRCHREMQAGPQQ